MENGYIKGCYILNNQLLLCCISHPPKFVMQKRLRYCLTVLNLIYLHKSLKFLVRFFQKDIGESASNCAGQLSPFVNHLHL